MRTLTVTLEEELYRALWEARGADRVSMTKRVQGLVAVWQRQPQLAIEVQRVAAQLPPAPTLEAGQRLTIKLDETAHARLLTARAEDRISMTDRIRALVALWQQRPALLEGESPTGT